MKFLSQFLTMAVLALAFSATSMAQVVDGEPVDKEAAVEDATVTVDFTDSLVAPEADKTCSMGCCEDGDCDKPCCDHVGERAHDHSVHQHDAEHGSPEYHHEHHASEHEHGQMCSGDDCAACCVDGECQGCEHCDADCS